MKQYTKKQKVAVALGAGAIAVAGAGSAFAYWTSTGSGDGTATAGAGNNDLTITNTAITGIVPGQTVPLSVKVTNPGSTDEVFNGMTAVVTTNNASTADDGTGCDPSDFVVSALPATGSVAHGATSTYTASLQFKNTATNQDGCKSAVVNIHYTTP